MKREFKVRRTTKKGEDSSELTVSNLVHPNWGRRRQKCRGGGEGRVVKGGGQKLYSNSSSGGGNGTVMWQPYWMVGKSVSTGRMGISRRRRGKGKKGRGSLSGVYRGYVGASRYH